jgi:hypothetical protein
MNLISNLKTVEEFSYISNFYEILVEKLGLFKLVDADSKEFEAFLKETVVIVEKEKFASEDIFLKSIKAVCGKGSNQQQHQHIHDLVKKHFSNLRGDFVEIKGIDSKSNQTMNFNTTIKLLVSKNFETLLGKIGDLCLLEIFQNCILMHKHKEIYIQIIGKSLQTYFERPKNSKPLANPSKKFRQDLSAKALLELSLDRNVFLYCLHSNKKADFFHKSVLYTIKREILARKKIVEKKNAGIKSLITPDVLKELFKAIFTEEKPNGKTKEHINNNLSIIIKNYMSMDMEIIFRKCCPFNFAKYVKCKNAYKKLKAQCQLKDASYDKLQKQFAENFVILTNMTIDDQMVYKFIKSVFVGIFPIGFFGHDNLKILLHYIKKLITMKRFETFALKEVYNKLNIKSINWFQREFNPLFEKEIRVSKISLISKLLYFTFTSIIHLIKANFFVTEKHNEHNKLFFYSKSVWMLITQFGTLQLELDNLRKVTEKSQLRPTSLIERPLGKLRFVPKNDSLRPIMTFHKRFRDVKQNKLIRIASFLTPVKIVLRSIKYSLSEKCGYSVFDNHQIFAKLEKFAEKWKARGKPFLYCASMDIRKCYDSVNLDKLFEFVKNETTFKEFYLVNNFFKIIRNKRFYFDEEKKDQSKKFTNLFLGKRRDTSNTIDDLSDLKNYFKDKIVYPGKTVFIDSGVKYLVTKDEIMDKLSFICNNVFVRFGKAYYQLNRGLPQGLSVSSVLSSFYYSVLEYNATNQLVKEIEDEDGLFLIMRLTDDYLIFSDKESYTTRIVDQLMRCAKENDFQFNKKKLKANFELNREFIMEPEHNYFKWIGKTFFLPNFEVEHTQILDKKEAFYTVNTNLPLDEKVFPDFLKGKFKTFFLNQNTFYFNKNINSDAKILTILPKIVTSSYYKLNTYITLLANRHTKRNVRKEGFMICKKLVETIIDCSYLISSFSTDLKLKFIIKLILEKIIEILEKDCDSKLKYYILVSLKERCPKVHKMKLMMIE